MEIKSFIGASPMRDFEAAVGQYLIYRSIVKRVEPERVVYLAIPDTAFSSFFSRRKAIPTFLQEYGIAVLVVDVAGQEVVQWLA